MSRAVVVALVGVAAITFASGTLAQEPASVARGKEVYAEQKCGMCHSVAGKGNPKGSLDGVAGKYKPEELRQWIADPKGMTAKTGAARKPPMKEFPGVAKADVDALVAYLSTLK